jgi:methyl-accepting chemotaxis protein
MKKFEQTGDHAGLLAFVDSQYKPTQAIYLGTIDKYIAEQVVQRDEALKALEVAQQHHVLVSGISVAVVFVLGVLLTRGLIRSITQPLDRAVSVAQAISAGDLTQDLRSERQDEIGQLLQALSGMNERLRSLVSQVRTGVDSVSTASTQIATGNHDLSARTEQTASNLQQTAASMQELTSTVVRSVDTAQQANLLVTQAAQSATRGGDVMTRVVDSMQQIDGSSKKINDIIGVIDSIAFQTNILALNAAVEAARAGEQGRGFAVVASEVRMLAKRSADAAKEIKTLIGESVSTVETGAKQVHEAGLAMGEIVKSVRRVSDLIGEITSSATEQRDGIDQVNQAVANLDQMTQQNAALVEESAAAAAALRDQAQHLADVVAIFNVGLDDPEFNYGVASAQAAPRVSTPEPVTFMSKPLSRLTHATVPKPVPGKAADSPDSWESF